MSEQKKTERASEYMPSVWPAPRCIHSRATRAAEWNNGSRLYSTALAIFQSNSDKNYFQLNYFSNRAGFTRTEWQIHCISRHLLYHPWQSRFPRQFSKMSCHTIPSNKVTLTLLPSKLVGLWLQPKFSCVTAKAICKDDTASTWFSGEQPLLHLNHHTERKSKAHREAICRSSVRPAANTNLQQCEATFKVTPAPLPLDSNHPRDPERKPPLPQPAQPLEPQGVIKWSLWFEATEFWSVLLAAIRNEDAIRRSFIFCSIVTAENIFATWLFIHSSNLYWHPLYARHRVSHWRRRKEEKQSSKKKNKKPYMLVGEKKIPKSQEHLNPRERTNTVNITALPSALLPSSSLCAFNVNVPQGHDPMEMEPLLFRPWPSPWLHTQCRQLPRLHTAGVPFPFVRNISAHQPQMTLPRRHGKTLISPSVTSQKRGWEMRSRGRGFITSSY